MIADHVDDVGGGAQLREDGVVDVEVGHGWFVVRVRTLSQFQDRGAVSSFVSVGGLQRFDRAVLAQVVPQAVAQAPGAVAVDDPEPGRAAEERLVERPLDGVDGLLEPVADDVDLGRGAASRQP